ncbi:MAG: hypothetical protein AWT59_1003 [Candidatus Gallionella acididurans]|uniref:Uncharacterized protein n=1 Tax=Candidatus Gallionella acididurans TaxID=1796491 RepID=A0A139BV50_9PROT|nr:MAG: hypothetical protein AWT59_1003 [Candidatus Gallionella acididurans]
MATVLWLIIDLSVIHYTVRPEVSKGVDRLMIGLRYLSPNGRFVANYGMLNSGMASCFTSQLAITNHLATLFWLLIDLSVIHYTVRPDVSKGVDLLVIGLRYLSPNGRFVANYGMLNSGMASVPPVVSSEGAADAAIQMV